MDEGSSASDAHQTFSGGVSRKIGIGVKKAAT